MVQEVEPCNRALCVDSADVSPVVDVGSNSPPPSQAELQGLQAGRHPDLSLEKAEVICCIGQLHSFDTTALAVHAVGAAHVVSARLAAWGYPDGVLSASLEGKVTALDDAYHGLLGVLRDHTAASRGISYHAPFGSNEQRLQPCAQKISLVARVRMVLGTGHL